MSAYYDRQGQPISLNEWIDLFADQAYKRVEIDVVGSSTISTVWLGCDHSFGSAPAPLIFETLVFGGSLDGEMQRYATEAEAVEGHADMLARALREQFAALH